MAGDLQLLPPSPYAVALGVLVHAKNFCTDVPAKRCRKARCERALRMIAHINKCKDTDNCQHKEEELGDCVTARQLLQHWDLCRSTHGLRLTASGAAIPMRPCDICQVASEVVSTAQSDNRTSSNAAAERGNKPHAHSLPPEYKDLVFGDVAEKGRAKKEARTKDVQEKERATSSSGNKAKKVDNKDEAKATLELVWKGIEPIDYNKSAQPKFSGDSDYQLRIQIIDRILQGTHKQKPTPQMLEQASVQRLILMARHTENLIYKEAKNGDDYRKMVDEQIERILQKREHNRQKAAGDD